MRSLPAFLCAPLILASACLAQDAAAFRIVIPPKLPAHVRFGDSFRTPVNKVPGRFALTQPRPVESSRCGHIVIMPVDPQLDAKIVRPTPPAETAPMPIIKGMPACPEDVR